MLVIARAFWRVQLKHFQMLQVQLILNCTAHRVITSYLHGVQAN